MKKFLPLMLCLSLSVFAMARATDPAHTPAPDTKKLLNDASTDEEVPSDDDDSVEIGPTDEGEDMNDDDDDGGDDDAGNEDSGIDDGADDGGDDGGDDEGG
jgi:hypothetical protein